MEKSSIYSPIVLDKAIHMRKTLILRLYEYPIIKNFLRSAGYFLRAKWEILKYLNSLIVQTFGPIVTQLYAVWRYLINSAPIHFIGVQVRRLISANWFKNLLKLIVIFQIVKYLRNRFWKQYIEYQITQIKEEEKAKI